MRVPRTMGRPDTLPGICSISSHCVQSISRAVSIRAMIGLLLQVIARHSLLAEWELHCGDYPDCLHDVPDDLSSLLEQLSHDQLEPNCVHLRTIWRPKGKTGSSLYAIRGERESCRDCSLSRSPRCGHVGWKRLRRR